MLGDAGLVFTAVSPDIDEAAIKTELLRQSAPALEIAGQLADAKALAVRSDAKTLVIGSDQILEQADGAILSKAGSQEEGLVQLRGLAGRTHKLHSAASLALDGAIVWRAGETARLAMRHLTNAEIATYVQAEWPHVRCDVGLYRIEGPGVQLFETIEGSYFAILGMPLLPLLAELRRRGATP